MKLTSIIAVLAFAFVANAQEGASAPAPTEQPAATSPAPHAEHGKKGHKEGKKKKHKKGGEKTEEGSH